MRSNRLRKFANGLPREVNGPPRRSASPSGVPEGLIAGQSPAQDARQSSLSISYKPIQLVQAITPPCSSCNELHHSACIREISLYTLGIGPQTPDGARAAILATILATILLQEAFLH